MLLGAQKRSGFVATLLILTAFGHAKARRDGCTSTYLRRPAPEATYRVVNPTNDVLYSQEDVLTNRVELVPVLCQGVYADADIQ